MKGTTISKRVHISGAGPVGLITALGLCQRGIPVTILESGDSVCQDLRAAYYHAPSVDMLEDIGFLDRLLAGGIIDRHPRFVDVELQREVEMDLGVLSRAYKNPYGVCAGQNWFTKVGHELLLQHDCEFRFGNRVTSAPYFAKKISAD